MTTSRAAQALLDQFAKDQGIRSLTLDDATGMIPIRLGADVQIAIGYSPANDSFNFFSVIDPKGEANLPDPWWAFERGRDLAERRTRIALEPWTGSLALIAEVFVVGLEYWRFREVLDRFVADVEAVAADYAALRSAAAAQPTGAGSLDDAIADSLVVFRV